MRNHINPESNIYLDGSSTTPTRIEVIERICEVEKLFWGNPSSIHYHGLMAAENLERSRRSISKELGTLVEDVIFTSGSTESNHLGIIGSTNKLKPGRIILSSVEHPSVKSAANKLVQQGWELELCSVDKYGLVDMDLLLSLLQPPTKIVSIIWGQSEIGTIQPIHEIGKLCQDRGIIFHTDATQILSQEIFDWSKLPVDLLSLSAHKFQGPKGVGLLLKRSTIDANFKSLQGGGGQENSFRSGTEPVSLIAGMALAIQLLDKPMLGNDSSNMSSYMNVNSKTKKLRNALRNIEHIKFTGHPDRRLGNHISMLVGSTKNLPLLGRSLVRELSNNGISASSGTACNSLKGSVGDTLQSIMVEREWRQSGLRFSLGPWITDNDIELIPKILTDTIELLS